MVNKYFLEDHKTGHMIAGGILAADLAGITIIKAMEVAGGRDFLYSSASPLEIAVQGGMIMALPTGLGFLTMLDEIPYSYEVMPDSSLLVAWMNFVCGASVGVGMAYLAMYAGEYLSKFF